MKKIEIIFNLYKKLNVPVRDREVAKMLNERLGSVRPRISELVKQKKIMVVSKIYMDYETAKRVRVTKIVK